MSFFTKLSSLVRNNSINKDGPTSDDLATEKKRNKVDSEKRKTAEADITSKEVVSKADNENKSDGTGSGSYENEDNEVGVAATSPIETYDKKGQNVSSITTTTTELTSSKVSAKDDKEANTLQAAVTSSLLAIEKNNQKDKIQEEIVAPIVVERNEVQKIILKSSRSRSATESDKWGASATLEIISTHSEVEDTAADKVVTSSSKTPLVQVSNTETDNKKNVLSPSTPVIDTVTENSKEQNGQKEDSDAALSKSLLDGVADAHKKYSVEGPEDSLEQKPTISCETHNDLTTVNDNVLLHLKTEQVPVKTLSARQTDERDDAAPVNYLSVDLRSVDLTAEDKRATADNSGACIERQKQNADPASYGVQKKFTSEDVLEQAHTDELCGVTAKREELLPTETLAHKSELLTGKSAEEFIRQTIKLQSACKTTSPSGEMDDKSKTETTESDTQSTSSTAIEDSKQQKTEQSARSNAEQETAAAPATPNNLKIVKKLADDGDTATRLAEEKKVELSFNEAVAEKENVTDGKQTSKDEKTDLISVEQISSVQAIKEASHLIESENVGAAVLITESTEPATVKVFEPKSESVKDNTEPEGGNTKKKSEPEEKSLKEKTSVVTENENQKPAAHTLGGSPKFAEAVKDEAAVDEGIVENGAEDDGEHSSDFTDEEVEPPETESQKSVAASGDAGSNNRKAEPDGNHDEAHDDEDVGEDLDFDEDKRNPQYIPKKGAFYEHDDRRGTDDESDEDTTGGARGEDGSKAGDGTESGAGGAGGIGGRGDSPELCGRGGRAPKVLQSETRDRWEHDLYDASEQGPKSVDELIAQYGYDIRDESAAPRAARRRKYGRGPNKYSRDWQDEKAYHSRATHGGQERHERHTGREGGRGDNNKEYHPRKDDFPCLNTASQQQQQQQPQQHASKDKDHERENRDHGGASRSERGDTRDNRREKDAPRRSDGGNKHEVQRRELPKKDPIGGNGPSYPTTAYPFTWSQRASSSANPAQSLGGADATDNTTLSHEANTSSSITQTAMTTHNINTTTSTAAAAAVVAATAAAAAASAAATSTAVPKVSAALVSTAGTQPSESPSGHKEPPAAGAGGPSPYQPVAVRNESLFENASLTAAAAGGNERSFNGNRGVWDRANRDADEQQPLEWRSGRGADSYGSRGGHHGDRRDRGDRGGERDRDYNGSGRDYGGNGRNGGGQGYYDRDYRRGDRMDRTDRDHNSGSRGGGDVGHRVIGGDRDRWRNQGSGRFGDHRSGGYDLRHKLDNNRNNDRFDSRGDNRRDNRGGQRDIFGDSHNGHSRGGGDSYRDNYRDSNNYRDSRDNYSRDNNRTGGGDGHGYRDSRDGGYRDRADRDRERDRDGGNTRDQRADSSYRGNNNRSDNNGRDSGYNQSRSDNNHRENWREGRDSYRENFHRDHAGGDTGHRENFQKDGSSRGGSDVRDIRGGNRSDPGRKIGSGRTQDPRAIRKGQQQHQQQTQLQQQPHQMHQQQQHEPTTNNNNNNNINNISGGSTGHQGKTGDAALDRKIVDEKRQHQQHIQQQNATNVSENKRYTAQRAATRAEYGANQVPASQSQPLPPQPQHHAPATHQPMASTHPHSNHNPPPPPHAGQQHPAYYEVAPPHGHPPPGASYFVSQAFDSGAVPTGAPPQGFAPAPFMGPPPPFITSQTHAAPFMMGGPVAPDGSVHHGPPHGHHHPKAQLIPPNGGITYFSPQQQMYISHQQKPPQPRPKAIIPIVPPPDAANHKNSNASAVASGGNPAGNSSGGGQGGPEPGAAAPAQVEA